MEEECSTISKCYCYFNIAEIRIQGTPPTIQCRNDLGVYEFDRAMENISIGIAQELKVDILISNVRVRITRSRYATYTYKRNHGIISDMLSRKWGIALDK